MSGVKDIEEIDALLKATVGSQIQLVGCRVVNDQPAYRVLIVRTRQPNMQLVVKLAEPGSTMASNFDRSAALYQRIARETRLSMPDVMAYDVTLKEWPWRYMIYTYLPGTLWMALRKRLDGSKQAKAYRQIGEAVGQLHSIEFPAFGEIDGLGQVQPVEKSCQAALQRHADRIIPSPRSRELFQAVLDTRADLFDSVRAAGLCHDDLHHANVLFSRRGGEWRLTRILDFDKAWAGPVESDLARLELWRGMTSPDFWAGYCALRDVPEGYPERRPVYQLLWCLEYARPTREHLNDTRKVCVELDCEIIERFE